MIEGLKVVDVQLNKDQKNREQNIEITIQDSIKYGIEWSVDVITKIVNVEKDIDVDE